VASIAIARVGDPLADADREAAQARAAVELAEGRGSAADETPAARAARRSEAGERQYLLGNWLQAAVLLNDAVDEPAWSGARERPAALFRLADALRREGLCGAARVRFAEVLALGDAEHRRDAVAGALDCAVKERRGADVARLLAEADRTFGADPPADVRYVAAKALFQRADLPEAARIAQASAAFEKVGPPFQLQAWYFRGVLAIQAKNLHESLQWFDGCARAEPKDARDVEVRDLCILALGRVHAEMNDAEAAVRWYASVPWDSPRFAEALHEQAWAHVRAKQYEQALGMASFLAEIEPDSPFAPEATLLRGHLLLRLGRYTEATEAFNVVINTYAPVRDEIDAILGMREDPVRYFNELIGKGGRAFDAAAVLPPVAARWATTTGEVALALGLVGAIDDARREVRDARDLAERLDVLLQRGGGLDAFPDLQRGYARAHAAENAAARAEAAYVTALGAVAAPVLSSDRRADLERARAARKAIEKRFDALPRTPAEVEERLGRMRGRIDDVDKELFRLGIVVRGCEAAISGSETFIERNRSEIASEAEDRQELGDELRKHRGMVETYDGELAVLRQDLAKARDAAGGIEALAEEAQVRTEYLGAIDLERLALEGVRGKLSEADAVLFDRADAARQKLAQLRARAHDVELAVVSDATRRSGALRARVGEERLALAEQDASLDRVQASSKDLLGEIALRSISDVRGQFYRLVLKADVGIVDVAWSRKRQRLDKIQQLAVQKDAEVEQLEREYKGLLKEIE
jgi:tetratricopeptide (TPR) repeat protein